MLSLALAAANYNFHLTQTVKSVSTANGNSVDANAIGGSRALTRSYGIISIFHECIFSCFFPLLAPFRVCVMLLAT